MVPLAGPRQGARAGRGECPARVYDWAAERTPEARIAVGVGWWLAFSVEWHADLVLPASCWDVAADVTRQAHGMPVITRCPVGWRLRPGPGTRRRGVWALTLPGLSRRL